MNKDLSNTSKRMNTLLITKLQQILNLGVQEKETNFNVIRIRILNGLLSILVFFQLCTFTLEVIKADYKGMLVLSIYLLLTVLLLVLNKFNKSRISIFIFNIVFPISIFVLLLIYKQPNDLEYVFFIFLVSAFLLQQGLIERFLIASLPFCFFLYSKSNHKYLGYLEQEINPISSNFILVSSMLIVLVILFILVWEMKSYDEKVNRLIIELENKNVELVDKNVELERFSHIVSHDMKTPLRAVAGYINILEKNLKNTDEENLRYFKYIKENATQLNDLVVETLEFSKTGKIEIDLEVVNVNEILFKLSRDFVAKDIQVYTEDFPNVLGSKTLVNKIFQNLIENGGKYNNSEEKIIEITYEIKDDKVIFLIKDNGIGIDEKYHSQIFEMYKRLHTKKEYRGTGLGLSICKKIVKRLGGDIYLTSVVEEGTTFYLELQLAK